MEKINYLFLCLILSMLYVGFTFGCKPSMNVVQGTSNGTIEPGYFLVAYPFVTTEFESIVSLQNLYFNKTYGAFVAYETGEYNFTFTCTDGTSVTASYAIVVPKLTIDQPKCINSKVNMSFSEDCTFVSINGNKAAVNGPWVVSREYYGYQQTFICTNPNYGGDYSYTFALPEPLHQQVVPLDISNAFCGLDGYIKVRSPSSYKSIQLFLNGNEITPNTTGDYRSLASASYTLLVSSDACGLEELTIDIQNAYPAVNVEVEPGVVCTNDYRVKLSVMGYEDVPTTWSIGGQIRSPSNVTVYPYTPLRVTPTISGACSFNQDIYLDSSYYLAITHSINYTDLCSGTGLAILDYPDYITISLVRDGDGNTVDFIDSDSKVFEIQFGMNYQVFAENCYGPDDSYGFVPMFPLPVLIEDEYPKGQGSCLYSTAFTVPNSYMFSNVEISNYANKYQMVDGRIEDVIRSNSPYTLRYNYISIDGNPCGSTQSVTGQSYMFAYESPQASDIKVDATLIGTCDNPTYNITLSSPSENYTTIFNLDQQVNQLYFTSPRSSSCYVFIYYNRTDFEGLSNPPTVDVLFNATCSYTTGRAQLNAGREDLTLTLNGYNQGSILNINPTFDLEPGYYEFVFTNPNNLCRYKTNITIGNDQPNFQFQYQVLSPIKDCSNSSQTGSIQVTNYQDYSSIEYMKTQAVNGVLTGLNGNGLISFNHQGCIALISASIAQNISPKSINPVFIRKPTCMANDGMLTFSVNLGGVDYEPQILLDTGGYVSYMNVAPSSKPLTFKLQAGQCIFEEELTIDLEDPQISINVIPRTCTTQSYAEVVINNPNVDFKYVESTTDNANVVAYSTVLNPKTVFYSDVAMTFEINVVIDVYWNSLCKATFTRTLALPVTPVPIIEITYPTSCDQKNITVTVKNYQEFTNLYIGNTQIVNGKISYVPNGWNNDDFYYTHVSSFCRTGESIIGKEMYNVTIPSGTIFTKETCTGSNDAVVSLPKGSTSYQVIKWAPSGGEMPELALRKVATATFDQQTIPNSFGTNMAIPSPYSYNLPQNNSQFGQLPSGFYTLISLGSNPFCVKRTDFVVSGYEPDLLVSSLGTCSAAGTSPLNVTFGLSSMLTYNISVDGVFVDDSVQYSPDVNHTVQVNITDPLCVRKFPAVSYSVAILPPISVVSDDSECETIVLSSPVSGNFRVDINDTADASNNLSFNYNFNDTNSNTFEMDIESGDYSVQFTSIDSGCLSVSNTLTIQKCSKKKSLAWIAGVVIGVIVAGLAAAFAFYKYKQRTKGTKVGMIDDPIQLKTVPIFTGGKVANIDQF